MISIEEAQQLMIQFIDLRNKAEKTQEPIDIKAYKKQQNLCVEKFSYLVTTKISKYKTFSNCEDLVQEGFEALTKAMKNYDPKKGIFFWWAHKYIDTRIARTANLHSTIRYPLKYAKDHVPHKESTLPTLIEEYNVPDRELDDFQTAYAISKCMDNLNSKQKEIITLFYGIGTHSPMTVNKICRKLGISRVVCNKYIEEAFEIMKNNIKI